MPGTDSSSRNTDIDASVLKGDFMRTAEEQSASQRRLTASDVYSPSKSNSSVYGLNSCVHSSRVGVFD